MKASLLILPCLLLILASCQDYDQLIIEPEVNIKSVNSNRVSIQDAIALANAGLKSVNEPGTRTSERHIVNSISCYPADYNVRSGNKDTLIYIINYDEGFAIIGADNRVLPMYAISDVGQFHPENISSSVQFMLNEICKDAEIRIMQANSSNSDTASPLLNGITPGGITVLNVPPMLSHRQSMMGANNCSKFTLNEWGMPALTCCVPIAVEMFISVYKWPETYLGYTFDWDKINAGEDEDALARMIAILSDPHHCYVQHNDATHMGSASHIRVLSTLDQLGFTRARGGYFFDTHEQKAREYLMRGLPLLMNAQHPEGTYEGGHEWVIDGAKTIYMNAFNDDGVMRPTPFVYYHCVWGDSGTCNGYYSFEFSSLSGEPEFFDENDSQDTSSSIYRIYEKSSIIFVQEVSIRK